MTKLIAILNVVAWAGFWSFGYLALTTPTEESARLVTALILAALGAAAGVWAWLRIVRHAEATGYAKPAARRTQPLKDEPDHA